MPPPLFYYCLIVFSLAFLWLLFFLSFGIKKILINGIKDSLVYDDRGNRFVPPDWEFFLEGNFGQRFLFIMRLLSKNNLLMMTGAIIVISLFPVPLFGIIPAETRVMGDYNISILWEASLVCLMIVSISFITHTFFIGKYWKMAEQRRRKLKQGKYVED